MLLRASGRQTTFVHVVLAAIFAFELLLLTGPTNVATASSQTAIETVVYRASLATVPIETLSNIPSNPLQTRSATESQSASLLTMSTDCLPTDPHDLVYVSNQSQLGRTRNFSATNPNWEDILGTVTGTITDFVLDLYDPCNVAYVGTDSGVWRTENLNDTSPNWTQVYNTYGVFRILQLSTGRLIVTNSGGWGTNFVTYSDDQGSSWQNSNTFPKDWYFDYLGRASITASPSGKIFANNDMYGYPGKYLFESNDRGINWTRIATSFDPTCDNPWPPGLALYSPSDDLLFWHTNGSGLTKFVDSTQCGTQTWNQSLNDQSYEDIAVWPGGGLIVETSSSPEQVYVVDDNGTPTLLTTSILPHGSAALTPLGDTNVLAWAALGLSVSDPQELAITRSTNGGVSWQYAGGDWATSIGSWSTWVGNAHIRSPFAVITKVSEDAVAGVGSAYPGADCPCTNEADETQANTGNGTGSQQSINTRTGNEMLYQVDFSIPTQSGILKFARSYSTFNARDVVSGAVNGGTMAPGWTHTYEVSLLTSTDPGGQTGKLILQSPDGSRLGFTGSNTSGYIGDAGVGGTLTYDSGNDTFTYLNPHGGGYVFYGDSPTPSSWARRMHYLVQPDGSKLTLTYNATSGLLEEIFEATETRKLTLTYQLYNGVQRLDRVTDNAGRYVEYSYVAIDSGANQLRMTGVQDVRGGIWGYAYDDTSSFPYFITERTDPDSKTLMSYEYDSEGRAFKEIDGNGKTVTELEFQADGITKVIRGEDGIGGTTTHTYDWRKTLVSNDNGAGITQTNRGNLDFRPTAIQDANGGDTSLSWSDDSANLTGITDALDQPTGFVYDAANHLTEMTRSDGTKVVFVYSAPTAAGLLLKQIDNYVDGTPGPGDDDLTTIYTYTTGADAPQPPNLVKRVDAPGGTTCTKYNAFGQVTESYANCDDMAQGLDDKDHLTTYTYDAVGRMTIMSAKGSTSDITDDVNTLYRYLDDDDIADEVVTNYDGSDMTVATNYYTTDVNGVLHNLSTRTFRDGTGHVIATVANYHPGDVPGSGTTVNYTFDGTSASLEVPGGAMEYNRVTLTNYDDAGRAYETITNYRPDLSAYDQGLYNLSSRTYFDGAGRVSATVTNYNTADLPGAGSPQNIDFDDDGNIDTTLEVSGDAQEYNQITRTEYDSAGRVNKSIRAYHPGVGSYYEAGGQIYNLVTAYEHDAVGNVTRTITNLDTTVTGGLGFDVRLDPDLTISAVPLHFNPSSPEKNRVTCTEYDALNRPVKTRTACIPSEDTDYFESGGQIYNLVTATEYDALGNVTKTITNYDASLTDTGTLDAYTISVQLTTDTEAHNLIVDPDVTDRNVVTCTTYDDLQRPVLTRQACVTGADYLQPSDGNPATDLAGEHNLYNLVTRTIYDDDGRAIATISNYNEAGGIINETTIDLVLSTQYNHVSRTYYDALGRTQYVVNEFEGNVLSSTPPLSTPTNAPDNRNLVTAYFYDEMGRQIATASNYAPDSDPVPVSAAFNHISRTFYNQRGQVTDVIQNIIGNLDDILTENDPDNAPAFSAANPDVNLRTTYTYDALGRQVEATADRDTDRTSHTGFDALGRTITLIGNYVDGTAGPGSDVDVIMSTTYTALGLATASTDPVGRVRRSVSNALGQTISSTVDPSGLDLETTTVYNAAGWVTTSTDGSGLKTTASYDALGRSVQTIIDPNDADPDVDLNLTSSMTYDLLGRVITSTDPKGITTLNRYDNLGRLIETFQNHITGTPTCGVAADDVDVCTKFEYDATGNLLTRTLGNGSVTEYQYDLMGRRIRETIDPSGEAIRTDFDYDAAGNQIAIIRAQGTGSTEITIDQSFDVLGRLLEIDYSDSTPDVTYEYDSFGNRKTMDDTPGGGRWAYHYDQMNHLLDVCSNLPDSILTPSSWDGADCAADDLVEYEYNAAGDRTDLDITGMSVTYDYNAAGRLSEITNPFAAGETYKYGYDDANRLLSGGRYTGTTLVGPETTYGYDTAKRLNSLNNGTSGEASSFDYHELDPLGNRTDVTEVFQIPVGFAYAAPAIAPRSGYAYAAPIQGPLAYQAAPLPENAGFSPVSYDLGMSGMMPAQRPGFAQVIDTPTSGGPDETPTPEPVDDVTEEAGPTEASTESPVETPVPVDTPTPTATPTEPATEEPTPTATETSEEPTATPSATQTETATPSPTGSPTATATAIGNCVPVFEQIPLEREQAEKAEAAVDGPVSDEADHQATVDEEGLHFDGAAEDSSQAGLDFQIALHAIARGDEVLVLPKVTEADTDSAWTACDNLVMRSRGDGVYEAVGMYDDHVEMAMLFEQDPLPPASSEDIQDMAIILNADTMLQPRIGPDGEIRYLDENQVGVAIGTATAIDASGRELVLEASADVEGVRLYIPGSWLAEAEYPVVIDPVVKRFTQCSPGDTGTPYPNPCTGISEIEPEIAYDTANNRALVAFLHTESGVTTIRTRLIEANTGNAVSGTSDLVLTGGGNHYVVFNPDGDSGGPEYWVAYTLSALVTLQRIDATDNTAIGSPITLTGSSAAFQDLAIAIVDDPQGNPDANYGNVLAMWYENVGGDYDVHGSIIDPTGTVIRQDFVIVNSDLDDRSEGAAYDQHIHKFVMVWRQHDIDNAKYQVRARTVPAGASGSMGGIKNLTTSTTSQKVHVDIEYNEAITDTTSPGQFLATWQSGGASASALGLTGGHIDQNTSTPPTDIDLAGNFAIASNSSGGNSIDNDNTAITGSPAHDWVIAWKETNITTGDIAIPIATIDGDTVTLATPVAAPSSVPVNNPAAIVRADGAPVVAYQAYDSTSTLYTLYISINAGGIGPELPTTQEYNWHYEYDGLNRVTRACSDDWNAIAETCGGDDFRYEYDGAGNATRFDRWNDGSDSVETVFQTYNGANQLTSTCIDVDNSDVCDGSETPVTYTYDLYGNLTSDGISTYTYDAANRLTSVTTGTNVTSYTYDGDGNRISQTVDTVTTTYVIDTATPLTMVLSETTSGQTIYYWHGLDTIAQNDGTDISYFEYDALGSVRQLTDDTGAVQLAQTFDPYGNGYASAGSATSSLGYTGEFSDLNGFVFLRARYYNPANGRFFQTDPSRREVNLFLYSMGNPVMLTDPSGNETIGSAKCWGDPEAVCQAYPPVTRPYIANTTHYASGYYGSTEYLEFSPAKDFNAVTTSGGYTPISQYDPGAYSDPRNTSDKLCGVFAIAAIAQNLGSDLGIDEIIDMYDYSVQTINTNKNSGSGWYMLQELVRLIPGLTSEPELIGNEEADIKTLSKDNAIYTGDQYPDYYNIKIRKALETDGKIPLVRVGLTAVGAPQCGSTQTCALAAVAPGAISHFVNITGLSTKTTWERGEAWRWVRIYNPFRNGTEYYPASIFRGFQPSGLETMYVFQKPTS